MYSNYSQIPTNNYSFPSYNNPNSKMPTSFSSTSIPYMNNSGDRLVGGGFFGPFLLGGITGGLLAPAFYPRPYYQLGPGPRPYPYYGPYYR